jgi:hypothetical protein
MFNVTLPAASKLEVPSYDNLIAHELANLLPMIEGREFEDLKKDIALKGILQPIIIFEGRILDGRNRYKAAKAIGHHFVPDNFKQFDGDFSAAEAYVISTNFHRRQLTNAQKAEVIRRMIEKYPEESNRGIARLCNISSHSVVQAVRERLENPPERREFEKFCKTFDKLEDGLRKEFAVKFAADLRELLA